MLSTTCTRLFRRPIATSCSWMRSGVIVTKATDKLAAAQIQARVALPFCKKNDGVTRFLERSRPGRRSRSVLDNYHVFWLPALVATTTTKA